MQGHSVHSIMHDLIACICVSAHNYFFDLNLKELVYCVHGYCVHSYCAQFKLFAQLFLCIVLWMNWTLWTYKLCAQLLSIKNSNSVHIFLNTVSSCKQVCHTHRGLWQRRTENQLLLNTSWFLWIKNLI